MKLEVPLIIPTIHSISLAINPSRIAFTIGIPPATAASNATVTPFSTAAAKISLPDSAIKALLAVTTCFPLAIALNTKSLATVVPPISSTKISTSGLSATENMSREMSIPVKSQSALSRLAPTWHTTISRPTRALISLRFRLSTLIVPLPTVPKPQIPIFTEFNVFALILKLVFTPKIKNNHHKHRFNITL